MRTFVKKLEKSQKAKGNSIILFENPDATSIGDTTLLKALNKKIKQDPNYPIPEDYKKVKEKELNYEYKLPDYVPIDENKKISMELLDELIFEKFDFHFLEPIISYKETLKVKPVITKKFKNSTADNTTPRYLQSLDKRQKPNELNDKMKRSSHQKKRHTTQRAPKLREVLALEVATFSRDKRDHAKEVAETLEEVLLAAEKGYKALPNREKFGPIGMKNQAIVDHEKKLKEERRIRKDKEAKRKKRDEQIKNEIKKKEEEKKKMLEDTKDERKRARDQKKQRKEELKKKRNQEREQRQQEYQEKKQQEQDELRQKQEAEEERERQKKEKFERENKEFLKQQAKKIRKGFKEMAQEKKSILQAQKEYEEMDQRLKENMKKKMEKHFEDNKENLKRDKEEKVALNKFMKGKSVISTFDTYETQLRYFYDYYCKSEHHEITRDIDRDFSTLNYKEFIKFGYEANIVPTIIPIQQIVYIFHLLVREANDLDPNNGQVLDYEFFKKALVRIAVVGQQLLGGQNGPKFEKKMTEYKSKEEEERKKKMSMSKRFSSPLSKMKTKKAEKSEKDDSDNDDESPKKDKKKDRREGDLAERGAKPRREKIVQPNLKEEKLKNATLIKGKLDDQLLLSKKSSSINKLYEIDQQARIIENLKNVKIENERITTE